MFIETQASVEYVNSFKKLPKYGLEVYDHLKSDRFFFNSLYYLNDMNILFKLLEKFDSTTGKPFYCERVMKWPELNIQQIQQIQPQQQFKKSNLNLNEQDQDRKSIRKSKHKIHLPKFLNKSFRSSKNKHKKKELDNFDEMESMDRTPSPTLSRTPSISSIITPPPSVITEPGQYPTSDYILTIVIDLIKNHVDFKRFDNELFESMIEKSKTEVNNQLESVEFESDNFHVKFQNVYHVKLVNWFEDTLNAKQIDACLEALKDFNLNRLKSKQLFYLLERINSDYVIKKDKIIAYSLTIDSIREKMERALLINPGLIEMLQVNKKMALIRFNFIITLSTTTLKQDLELILNRNRSFNLD